MTASIGTTSREIWVSATGSNNNSGTQQSPYKTIQHAVNQATPDTTIYVRAGTYTESVVLSGKTNRALSDTTADMPIRLVSADGVGAAVIKAPNHASGNLANNKSAVTIFELANIAIDGFKIVANAAAAHDEGGLKFIGGEEFVNRSGNILIQNNIFAGVGVDAIKATKTDKMAIKNNVFDGKFSEQTIDLIAITHSEVTANSFLGIADSGLGMKGGSHYIQVSGNHFDFSSPDGKGPAVKIGGEMFSADANLRPAAYKGFEARYITVKNNVIDDSGVYSVLIQGGQNSTIEDNYFGNDGSYAIRTAYSRSTDPVTQSGGNTIRDNILETPLKLHTLQSGATNAGTVMTGNVTGTKGAVDFDYGAGATVGDGGSVGGSTGGDSGSTGGSTGGDGGSTGGSTGGAVTLEVVVGGTGTSGAPPRFEVLADGVSLGVRSVADPVASRRFDVANDALYDSFAFTLAGGAPNRVDIVYFNDGTSGGVNRDLVVDHIVLGGVTLESEIHGFFRAKSGNAAFDGPAERLYVNGTLSFADLDQLI